MKLPRNTAVALVVLAVVVSGAITSRSPAGEPAKSVAPAAPATQLVVHEWGTFTSFAGSDGVPAHFSSNYTDLPPFIYSQTGPRTTKKVRITRDGTISMETPVIYFYSERDMKLSVKVDFPRGWITEWYPFASTSPAPAGPAGQSMQWDVRLLPGESVRFPGNPNNKNNYYQARDTDSAPLQVEAKRASEDDDLHGGESRGDSLVQREKFLFYRGVGTFPPPATLKALGGGKVLISNAASGRIDGLVLVNVQAANVGFKVLGGLGAGGETTATIPPPEGRKSDLVEKLVKLLTSAGLYEKEAQAMVKTWDSAWFGESGTRLLYLVPKARMEELLPLTINPKPTETSRVLVGRHDFLTPEQEAEVDDVVKRVRTRQLSQIDAESQLRKLGRFWPQARTMAEKRLEVPAARR